MNDSLHQLLSTDEKLAQFTQQRHRAADQTMRYFILGYFVLGLLLAFYYDTWLYAIGIGGLSTIAYFVSIHWAAGSMTSRMTISIIFALYMFQFVGQMHGMYEMHFFFFINITILLMYQDWRVLVPYTALIVLHHSVLFLLQMAGADVRNYAVNVDVMTYTIIAFHLGLAAFMAVVCGWWAIKLQKRSSEDFVNKIALEQQLSRVNQNVDFASEITQGNLDVAYKLDDEDELGKSLFKMRDSLLKASKKDMQEKFTSTGMAEIGTILREHASDLHELSYHVISYIIKYLAINQGGMFILREDEGDAHLSMTACYAFDRRKYLKRRIELGEGLVGQAAMEKETIYMTDVPTGYVNITSGLGVAPPRSVLILPLQSNKEVVGVMEFAALRPFEPFEIDFLEKLAESIAASVISAQTNEQTKQLLEQAQESEESMRAQEEEMRQNMEELQATQEEADRKVNEYEALLRKKDEEIQQLAAAVGR